MPTYSYACTACDHRFDAQQSFSDDALTKCPQCEGRLRKLFGSVGVVFKGSGFYRTDSRPSSTSSASSSSGDTASSGSSSSSGGSASSGGSGASGSGGSGASSGTSSTSSSGTPSAAKAPAAAS
nr:FmdB family zinc ribbon protein [uncultured Actinotalea sp.]